jgi:hypothetical protein
VDCGAWEFFSSDGRRAALGVFFERLRPLEEKVLSAMDEHGCPRADARIGTRHGRPIPAAFRCWIPHLRTIISD